MGSAVTAPKGIGGALQQLQRGGSGASAMQRKRPRGTAAVECASIVVMFHTCCSMAGEGSHESALMPCLVAQQHA